MNFPNYNIVPLRNVESNEENVQGCALAEPSGAWRLTFALGRLENLIFFHTNHMLGTLDFTVSSTGLPSIFLRAQP